MNRWVLHVDLDQFIAAVEVLRNPELAGKPVIVGGDGDPSKRGVVSTASYEARAFGVRSGMALRIAKRRCPDAVFLPVDAPAYEAASKEVMETLRTFHAVVEVAGWDEAFMEVASDDPVALAHRIREAVLDRTRLSCSIGVGQNKLQAKIATEMGKPAGVAMLTHSTWHEVMDERPPDALWGIGKKRTVQLSEMGLRTVAQLAGADVGMLAARFGPQTGPWLRTLARGESDWPVSAEPWIRRSYGHEETFQRDLAEPAEVREAVERLAARVAADVAGDGRRGVRVVVKLRFAPFVTKTLGAAMEQPGTDAKVIHRAALAALDRFTIDRPVRLAGVRVEMERERD